MKKIIKISGIFALSAIMFSVSNRIQDGETINLDSLITLSVANAEGGGGGSHTCYTTSSGTSSLLYDCSDCKQIKCNGVMTNKSTCTAS